MKIPFVSPKVHGLMHAGITVSDFGAAVKWYHDMFGCLLVSEQTLDNSVLEPMANLYGSHGLSTHLGFLRTPDGGVFEIFEFTPKQEKLKCEWNRPGFTHACIAVRNVPKLRAELEAKGVEFVTPINATAGTHWCFCKDLDGNFIEIMDLHVQRLPLKYVGWALGLIGKKGQWASYYK